MKKAIEDPATSQIAEHKLIDIRLVNEDKANPRKYFDEEALKELAADIKVHGIIQPILVRVDPDRSIMLPKKFVGKDCYSIVCGARRFRAAIMADLDEVPCIIRSLNDDEAFEFQISENLNRKDVNPMEESDAFDQLIKRGISTAELISDKFGVSKKYIYDRIVLQKVVPEVQEAIREGKLTISHGKQFARLPLFDQAKLLEKVDLTDKDLTVIDIKETINNTFKLKLNTAVFNIEDAKLVKKAGSCLKCTKRTGCNLLLFEDVQSDDICLDSTCYETKVQAHIEKTIEELKATGKVVKLLSGIYGKPKEGLVSNSDWEELDEDDQSNTVGIFMEVSQYSCYKIGQVINIEDIEEINENGDDNQDDDTVDYSRFHNGIDYNEVFVEKCVVAVVEAFKTKEEFPESDMSTFIQFVHNIFYTLNDFTKEQIFAALSVPKIDDQNKPTTLCSGYAFKIFLGDITTLSELLKIHNLLEQLSCVEDFEHYPDQEEIEAVQTKLDGLGIDFFAIAESIESPPRELYSITEAEPEEA